VFRDDSAICLAAVFSGAVDDNSGGDFLLGTEAG